MSFTIKHPLIVENQVIMFAKNNNSVKFGDDRELATFPTLPNLVSVENDATLAKSATAVGYAHKRKIEQMTRCTDLEFVRTVGTGGPVKFFLTV